MPRAISNPAPISVETAFSDFYVVPDFQREYVWAPKQIKELLKDIYEAFQNDADNSAYYFIGSLVLFKPSHKTFWLVDGQQRMTTLFIMLCCLRDRIRKLNPLGDVAHIENCIRSIASSSGGTGSTRRPRLTMQYEGDVEVLDKIIDGNRKGPKLSSRDRGKPLLDAYKALDRFIEEHLDADESAHGQFANFLLQRVELLPLVTEDFQQALIIFERINYRGTPLNALDLLKNLLFKQSGQGDKDPLAKEWREVTNILRAGDERNYMRFLRYFTVSSYDFSKMPRADEVFEWFLNNADTRVGKGAQTVQFVRELQKSARSYAHMLAGKGPRGEENAALSGILAQKTGVRQHLPILLAASHLPVADFRVLCDRIEAMTFTFVLAGAQWNEVERLAPVWCKALREVRDRAALDRFITSSVDPVIEAKREDALKQLEDTSGLRKGFVKYILAKLTERVERECGKRVELVSLLDDSVTIEHILPQSVELEVIRDGFHSKESAQASVHKLANLTLLHQSPNASASNKPFARKVEIYKRSDYELTKSLVTDLEIGGNTKYGAASRKYDLSPFETWDESAIARRKEQLARIIKDVWGV